MTIEYFGSHCKYDDLIDSTSDHNFSNLEIFNKHYSKNMKYPNYFCIDNDDRNDYPLSLAVNGFTTTNPIWIRRFCDAVIYNKDPDVYNEDLDVYFPEIENE